MKTAAASLSPNDLIPAELEFIAKEHELPALHLTASLKTAYWPSLEGYSADGLILAYADRVEGFDECARQYRSLREELALLGLSPRSVIASVGDRSLGPSDRHDLEILVDLVRSEDLNWVAASGLDAITDDIVVSSTLIGELGGTDLWMLPFDDAAKVPGTVGEGELLDKRSKEQLVSALLEARPLQPSEWSQAQAEHGTYGLFLAPELDSADSTAPAYLQLSARKDLPVYLGRTLNETVAERLTEHAERISDGGELELDWFRAKFVTATNARLAYRGKRAVVEAIGTPSWQRSGFAG